MTGFFSWNGERSTDYGVYVSVPPALTLPLEKTVFTDVPGRSGSLTTLQGDEVYDDITMTVECFVGSGENIATIGKWLKGNGELTFGNRPGGHYKAKVVNQIRFEQILRGNPHQSFAINFRCKPFFYIEGQSEIVLEESGGIIENVHAVHSTPTLTVVGTGDITLIVGLYVVELEGVDGSITIDSETMSVYKGADFFSEKMTGAFPRLDTGVTAISWVGDVSQVVVKPNWRTL